MDARAKAQIERIETLLIEEGYRNETIYQQSETGYGDFKSYFDVLVDCHLAGEGYPTHVQVFNNMKRQINYLNANLAKASEDYLSLQNKCRYLEKDKEELIKNE